MPYFMQRSHVTIQGYLQGRFYGGLGGRPLQWKMCPPVPPPFWPSLPKLSLKYTSNILNSAAKYSNILNSAPPAPSWNCGPHWPHLASARTAPRYLEYIIQLVRIRVGRGPGPSMGWVGCMGFFKFCVGWVGLGSDLRWNYCNHRTAFTNVTFLLRANTLTDHTLTDLRSQLSAAVRWSCLMYCMWLVTAVKWTLNIGFETI